MSNHVLIVSDQHKELSDIIECFINRGVHITILPFRKIEEGNQLDDDHTFILYHASMHEHLDLSVIKHMRKLSKWPIFVLAKDEQMDKVTTYMKHGAEGYFLMSMSCELIYTKTLAVIRYIKENVYQTQKIVNYGDLVIDLSNRMIKTRHQQHKLTINEYYILRVLIEEANRVVSKDEMIAKIWDDHSSATDNALGIHISRLRKKTITSDGRQLIETIWGVGYRLNLDH